MAIDGSNSTQTSLFSISQPPDYPRSRYVDIFSLYHVKKTFFLIGQAFPFRNQFPYKMLPPASSPTLPLSSF